MSRGILYVGTHSRPHRADPIDVAFGIYLFRHEPGSEVLTAGGMTETLQPGWIALDSTGSTLYAANEIRSIDGEDAGAVSAFAVDPGNGSLRFLNSQRTRQMPCHCQVDSTGRFLIVASYGGGAVHLFPLASDGRIGPETDLHVHTGSSAHPLRQAQPHPHAVVIDSANRFVFVPDLGTDIIHIYKLDPEKGKLLNRPERNVRVAPGSGPRHIVFDDKQRFAYLINEMAATITLFAYDSALGSLEFIQTVDLLPEGFSGFRSAAEIGLNPSGRFLYATTRSHLSGPAPPVRGLDTIVWFRIDPHDGTLHSPTRISSGGEVPRHFAFNPSDGLLYVGNQMSGTIVPFRIDPQTGEPVPTSSVIATPVPVCLQFSRPA